MSESDEMAAALDKIGIHGVVEDVIEDDVIDEDDDIEEVEDDAIDETPPGFISHADYVAKNGNDDGWKGKAAYNAEYKRIQDNKELRNEIKGMNDMLKQTVAATQSMQDAAYQRGLESAKAELQEALDNNDAQGVYDAQAKIQSMPKPQAAPRINPVHSEFFSSNPIVDSGSDQYDGELMGEFQRIYNGRLQVDGVRPDQELSPRAIKGYMSEALKSAKSLFPEKFESPRNLRKTTQQSNKRTTVKSAPVDALKNQRFTTKNSRDTNPAMDIYNSILNAKDGGKDAADKFAQKMGISV